VELLATDSVGGTTTLKYQLTVTEPLSNDTTPPVITLAGDNPLTVLWGLTWIDDFSAFDAGDNTNVTVTRVNQVDTKKPGTYTNLYTAADSKGNAATNTRVVHVRFANGGSERAAGRGALRPGCGWNEPAGAVAPAGGQCERQPTGVELPGEARRGAGGAGAGGEHLVGQQQQLDDERGDGDPGGDDECEWGSVGAAAGHCAGGWDEEVFEAEGDESVVVG
jgi:hypothetical protein